MVMVMNIQSSVKSQYQLLSEVTVLAINSLSFNYEDAGFGPYNDTEETFTIDGVEFGYIEFGNYDDTTMQGRANDGRIYNMNNLNIAEIVITFDPNQQYDPTFTFFGGYDANDEDTELTADVEERVYTYDFTDTDFTHFLIRNDNYALYIMEVEITFELTD